MKSIFFIVNKSLICCLEHTCCSLSNERCTDTCGVLSQDFDVVGGSRLQVGRCERGDVSNEEADWLIFAWKQEGKLRKTEY